MPEYLAPGVYVEETSFRAKSIEGVGTSTTAFVGPTRKGPFRLDLDDLSTPELLTSYGDFERIYGSFADLDFGAGVAATNFVAHAARAFFNEGGGRLYVARVFAGDRANLPLAHIVLNPAAVAASRVGFVARFPGAAGNGRIIAREVVTPASGIVMTNAAAGSLLRTGPDNALVHSVKVGTDIGGSVRMPSHLCGEQSGRGGRRSGDVDRSQSTHGDHDRHYPRCRRQRDHIRRSRV